MTREIDTAIGEAFDRFFESVRATGIADGWLYYRRGHGYRSLAIAADPPSAEHERASAVNVGSMTRTGAIVRLREVVAGLPLYGGEGIR